MEPVRHKQSGITSGNQSDKKRKTMEQDHSTDEIRQAAAGIAENYNDYDVPMYGSLLRLPERNAVIDILHDLQKLLFPAYFGDPYLTRLPPQQYSALLLEHIQKKLCKQISLALEETPENITAAREICSAIIQKIPDIQRYLAKDLTATFEGDPAAKSKMEVLFSYPGFFAIFVYRIAHELYLRQVPLIPRMMTEYAHSKTGIDIHPGAVIGEYFFIDHGTGIVIGETTIIGSHVRIYQGATLGALSPKSGQARSDTKRHPTVGNNVTIYSGATILGGETVIGDNVTIGGNVFLTDSVPANTRVSIKAPELKFREAEF
ncbi:serine O-acetyltransferase EpsC [Flexilinea flocculi]|jgi:serine O-acetyltransferase|nr:serine O-acetyltransferase EpsC [Flexilinea flocculi]